MKDAEEVDGLQIMGLGNHYTNIKCLKNMSKNQHIWKMADRGN